MIFGHCHLFPGGLPEKRDPWGLPGSAEHLFGFMRACGFAQAQAIAPFEAPLAAAAQARIEGDGLGWLLAQPHVGVAADAPLQPVATINPTLPGALEGLRRARRLGVRMLKFHPLILGFDVFAPACASFLEEAQRGGMPVTYHTGVREGWGVVSECVSPAACGELAGRYPGLPILMAHCGTFGGDRAFVQQSFAQAMGQCEAHDNLYLEATAALLNVGEAPWRQAVQRLGADRIVYGRDYPWTSVRMVQDDLAFLSRIGLNEEGIGLVLGGNLQRLWQHAG